jgi:hypothetical protein
MCTGAIAQTLPSADLISPGFSKWLETADTAEMTTLYVNGSVDQLFHIRDLSVLQSLLSLITIESCSGQVQGRDVSNVKLLTGNEIIADAAYIVDNTELRFSLGENQYAVPFSEFNLSGENISEFDLPAIRTFFSANSWIERMDMHRLSEMLRTGELFRCIPGFDAGELQVSESFSDDGLRLTRMNIDGYFFVASDVWSVKGTIFKPGGNSPKDTAEFHLMKDENNRLDVTLSSKYTLEKGKSEQNGAVTGNCRINVAGKIGGYDITYVIGLKIRNDWSADGHILAERLTVTPSLNWTDKTPGRRTLHLNSGSLNVKNVIQITSSEDSEMVSEGTNQISMELKMDGESVVSGSFGIYFAAGPGTLTVPVHGVEINRKSIKQLMDSYIDEIAKKMYQQLNEKTHKRIVQGL